jgi:hypothetical protein
MSVIVIDENTSQDSSEFKPFNEGPKEILQVSNVVLSGGMDTKDVDGLRQGIEISTEAHRFKGFGGKIWAGNIKGYTAIKTLGQAVSFTEYKNDKRFNDLLVKFNPVSYIELGEQYPFPLVFNEGPQQNKESSIQPFTIPFRNGRDTNEAVEFAHDVRGSVEDGNQNLLKLNGHTNKIQQFIPYYNLRSVNAPFLDEGEDTFGQTLSGSIKLPGYINGQETNIVPFDDRAQNKILDQFSINTMFFPTIVPASDLELDVVLSSDPLALSPIL